MKKITIRFLLLLNLAFAVLSDIHACSSPDLTELDPAKVYFVHASQVMLENARAKTGGLVGAEGLKLASPHIIPTRVTLHHCIGGLVPAEMMGVNASIGGFSFSLPTAGGHDFSRYVYIDAYPNFVGDVIGGEVNDTFTTSHVYGEGSIALIPTEDEARFHEQNPDFKGQLRLYDRKSDSTRDLVSQLLEERGAYRVSFDHRRKSPIANVPVSSYEQLNINGQIVSDTVFENFYHSENLLLRNHNHTRWCALEQLIHLLNAPFMIQQLWAQNGKQHTRKKAHIAVLPEHHLKVVMTLLDDQFERLKQEVDPRHHPGVIAAMIAWQESYLSFARLYVRELELAKEKKSIFESFATLGYILENKDMPEVLDELGSTLTQMTSREFQRFERDKGSSNLSLTHKVPEYFNFMTYLPQQEQQEICSSLEASFTQWQLGARVQMSMLLRYLIIKKWQYLPERFQEYFPRLAEKLVSQDKAGLKFLKEELAQIYEFRDIKTPDVMHLLNTSTEIAHGFRLLLELPAGEEISLEDVLSSLKPTNMLFGNALPSYLGCTEFLRKFALEKAQEKLVLEKMSALQYAAAFAQQFVRFATKLETMPINPNLQNPYDSGLLSFTSLLSAINPEATQIVQSMQQNYDLEQTLLRTSLQEEHFGSLDDIFGAMGLKEKFRAMFPTDEDFWNLPLEKFGYSPTFANIYTILQSQS